MRKRHIAILGSTGSIGTQALEVVRENPDRFQVEVLTANNSASLLIEQAKQFKPNAVAICNEDLYREVKEGLKDEPVKVYAGHDAVEQLVQSEEVNMVLTAMVGFAGLRSTIKAIEAGKAIALANKETLVVAGTLITQMARECRVPILPVDSEHSAIFQCLVGESNNEIEKITLTASGGPFRGRSRAELEHVGPEQALKHPNWTMGAKITIDSATLMNKGLEVIEAKWLFGLEPEQVEVVVHPQSIIHSLVQFRDGSMKAQMGLPDMKLPIAYALAFPDRLSNKWPRFSFLDYPTLTFEQPSYENFPCLGIAFEAMKESGNMPCIMNAANEMAVEAFLNRSIGFNAIPALIEKTMERVSFLPQPALQDLLETDREARTIIKELIAH